MSIAIVGKVIMNKLLGRYFFVISMFFSSYTHAKCYDTNTNVIHTQGININLTGKLIDRNSKYPVTETTKFTGIISCNNDRNNVFTYTSLAPRDRPIYIGFNKGLQWVRVAINTDLSGNHVVNKKFIEASELNKSFEIEFQRVDRKPLLASGIEVTGDNVEMNSLIILANRRGNLNLLELGWVLSLFRTWPPIEGDLYAQTVEIRLSNYATTCKFNNAGLTVSLPKVSRTQLVAGGENSQLGKTPFTLNMSCDGLTANNTTDRNIKMFLSSNNLHATDKSLMVDSAAGAASGVGLRLMHENNLGQPVVLSSSNTAIGNATALFSRNSGAAVNSNFEIPMSVHYYPHQPNNIKAGKIKTSATLNIIYD